MNHLGLTCIVLCLLVGTFAAQVCTYKLPYILSFDTTGHVSFVGNSANDGLTVDTAVYLLEDVSGWLVLRILTS